MRGFTLHQSVVPAAPLSINSDFRLCQTGHQIRRQWLAVVRGHLRWPKVELLVCLLEHLLGNRFEGSRNGLGFYLAACRCLDRCQTESSLAVKIHADSGVLVFRKKTGDASTSLGLFDLHKRTEIRIPRCRPPVLLVDVNARGTVDGIVLNVAGDGSGYFDERQRILRL